MDSVESVDYKLPPLRLLKLHVQIAKKKLIPALSDVIESVTLESNGKEIILDEGSERQKILSMVEAVRREDPDVVLTEGGDSFLFLYLTHRALVNGVLSRFFLGRENILLNAQGRCGTTFFSYGRVYFKAPMRRLYGRIHIDAQNT